MGRIVVQVVITNPLEPGKRVETSAMVDTGANYMTLPSAWRDRLGQFAQSDKIAMELADQSGLEGEVCGPVGIQIEGFRRIPNEVLFVPMEPDDGQYEPLVGYLPLEQCQAAVDMVGHRLLPVKRAALN